MNRWIGIEARWNMVIQSYRHPSWSFLTCLRFDSGEAPDISKLYTIIINFNVYVCIYIYIHIVI